MKKEIIQLLIGLVMMVAAVYNANLDISNTWHYFSNGVVFGLGFSLVFVRVKQMLKK